MDGRKGGRETARLDREEGRATGGRKRGRQVRYSERSNTGNENEGREEAKVDWQRQIIKGSEA